MPDTSRIWVYQSKRALTEQEANYIIKSGNEFISEWTSHGKMMNAAIEIFHNQFIVLAVDEAAAKASGCGIDKSVKYFNALDSELRLDLFNRLNTAYSIQNEIKTCSINDFENHLQSGKLNSDTLVFNNLISLKAEIDNNWLIPVSRSWHSKFLSPN